MVLSWLHNKLHRRAIRIQQRDLEAFVDMISQMNSDTIGTLLVNATHMRNVLESLYGWNLLCPFEELARNPFITMRLARLTRRAQKEKAFRTSAALMVWLHTMRAVQSLQLRGLGRRLWKEIGRGRMHFYSAAEEWYLLTGRAPQTDGFLQTPDGLEPTVL